MASNLFNKLEDLFYDYTHKYDENIKELMKNRGVEITIEELEEILHDAKHNVTE